MVARNKSSRSQKVIKGGRCVVEKVPPEVLSEILVLAIPDDFGFRHANRRVPTFLSVSRQWRRCAIITRGLWQRIDCSVPMFARVPQELHMEMLDLWLQGANNAPFHVACRMSNERSQEAWRRVLPTMQHWRTVEYTCNPLEDYCSILSEDSHKLHFNRPLLRLDRLKLGGSGNVGKIEAPGLQELSISRPNALDWNAIIATYKSIHALELEDSPSFMESMLFLKNVRELSCGYQDVDRAPRNDLFSSFLITRVPNCTHLRLYTCRLKPVCLLPQITHLSVERALWLGADENDNWFGMFPTLRSLTLSRFGDDMSTLLDMLASPESTVIPMLNSFALISSLVKAESVIRFSDRRSPPIRRSSAGRQAMATCEITVRDCRKPVSFSLQESLQLPDVEKADFTTIRRVMTPHITPKKPVRGRPEKTGKGS